MGLWKKQANPGKRTQQVQDPEDCVRVKMNGQGEGRRAGEGGKEASGSAWEQQGCDGPGAGRAEECIGWIEGD